MECLELWAEWLECVPVWIPFGVMPGIQLVCGVILAFFAGKRYYPYLTGAGCAAGTALLAHDPRAALLFLALYGFLSAALGLLFVLPVRRRMRTLSFSETACVKARTNRAEEPRPPEQKQTAEECGLTLTHAEEVLARLSRMPLSPADKLEREALSRTVEHARCSLLGEEDRLRLNDCLAVTLKLAAKYKL